MATGIGRINKVGIGIESTWGTKPATIDFIPVLEFNPNPQIETVMDESSVGRIEKPIDQQLVREWSEPSLSAIVYQEHIGYFLKAIFGTLSTTGPTDTSAYTHDFTVKNDQTPVSLTLIFEDANQEEKITGCVVNTASISLVNNDYAKIDLTFIGKKQAADTDAASYTAENAFNGCMANIKFATNVAGLGAASAIAFQEASFEINKNAEAIFSLGSCEPTSIINKSFEANGAFTIAMANETYRTLFLANTQNAISFNLTNTGVTIGAATNPSLTFTFANVNFADWAEGTGLDDVKNETFSFNANYLLTDNMIDCTLVNTKVSY